MTKYLKKFDNHADYLSYMGGEPLFPNVSFCEGGDEMHYNAFKYHGHEYVDLALPSGTLWATCNMGADDMFGGGMFFAWGETDGYTAAQVGTDKVFDLTNYTLYNDADDVFTKYNETDGLTRIEIADDAARLYMAGFWHMPTYDQCNELKNSLLVIETWVDDYQGSGVSGRLFTSKANGETVFFPALGVGVESAVEGVGENSFYLSSDLNVDEGDEIWGLLSSIHSVPSLTSGKRFVGGFIRGVVEK